MFELSSVKEYVQAFQLLTQNDTYHSMTDCTSHRHTAGSQCETPLSAVLGPLSVKRKSSSVQVTDRVRACASLFACLFVGVVTAAEAAPGTDGYVIKTRLTTEKSKINNKRQRWGFVFLPVSARRTKKGWE